MYFPFPGAEKFVPLATGPKQASKEKYVVFPWGPVKTGTGEEKDVNFLGQGGGGPLWGKVIQIYHSTRDNVFERSVFSLDVTTFGNKQETLYVYAVRADGSHFVDKVAIHDIYLATRLVDIQRAFPELNIF
jgi:hypothetical protein